MNSIGNVQFEMINTFFLLKSKKLNRYFSFDCNLQVYVKIKDEVVSFFHGQGITIVTIQPEFNTKSANDQKTNALVECLIGCQSIECAPKTCCSTNDLDAILVGADKKKQKCAKTAKGDRKSSSMVSLNVTSLGKLRKLTGSTQDMIKKCVSESHVTEICSDDSVDSQNTSTNASSTANNLYAITDSIDELKEDEFHAKCDARSEERLAPLSRQSHQLEQFESNAEHEDSKLLDKPDELAPPSNQTVDNRAEEGTVAHVNA